MGNWMEFRNRLDATRHAKWWDSQKLIFSHCFRFPVPCGTLTIVIGRTENIQFVQEKLERLCSSMPGAQITIVIEEPRVIAPPPNADAALVTLSGPLSQTLPAAIADGRVPDNTDCTITFSPETWYDDLAYIVRIPLNVYLKKHTRCLLTLNNLNYLSEYDHPPDREYTAGGHRLYGHASLMEEDIELIFRYASAAGGGDYVEIGRFLGGSTCIIAQALSLLDNNSRFHSFDPLLPDVVGEILAKNRLADKVTLHKTGSREGFAQSAALFPDGIDFLFVDGDHSYNGVLNDLTTWATLLKKGGILVMHDYCNLLTGELTAVDVAIYKGVFSGGFEVVDTGFTCLAARKV